MVFEFFRSADSGLDEIEERVSKMLADARHSFGLAMGALLADDDIGQVAAEVYATDVRINALEEAVRRELIVHDAVRGGTDINAVLDLQLVVKKLERVGDQAKNILELALQGVRFTAPEEREDFDSYRGRVEHVFAAAEELIGLDDPDIDSFVDECRTLMDDCEQVVLRSLRAEGPGSVVVPRAMLARYLKRMVANLLGTVAVEVQGGEGGERLGGEDLDE